MKKTLFQFTVMLSALACVSILLSCTYCHKVQALQKKFTVRQDSLGDFSSISEAVNTVPSGSTLIIYEGVYNEHIDIIDKTVNLEGRSRDNCIIQYNGSNYFEPPLFIAAGKVSNLTLYSCADKKGNWIHQPPAVIDPDIPASQFKEYSLHIEQNYLSGRELSFENCLFVSDKSHCVGMGLRKDCAVSFTNCEFRAYGSGGAVFVHDTPFSDYLGESSLRFIDCTMYNYNSIYFFYVFSYNMSNRVNLTFRNVKVHTVGYSNPSVYNADNDYNGRNIETINTLDASDLLIENGYRLNDLIFCLNAEETQKYNAESNACVSSLEHKLLIPEGITRLLNGEMPPTPNNMFPIYISNKDCKSRDGWCGCANFFLTPDSYGNTFAEMNYKETLQTP